MTRAPKMAERDCHVCGEHVRWSPAAAAFFHTDAGPEWGTIARDTVPRGEGPTRSGEPGKGLMSGLNRTVRR